MNNLPERQAIADYPPQLQFADEERLQDYLENLIAPLIGIVPYAERAALRQETYAHLEGLIREYQWQGQDLREATETALKEFGEPWKVGQAFLQEWLQGAFAQRPELLIRKASTIAFAWFGMASMLILLLLERAALVPGREALLPGIGLLAFFAPFMAGGLTGAMSPAQAERGVRNAVLLLVTHSFITSLLMLPRTEGLLLAGWQLLFWLSAGRVSAAAAALGLRQTRRQHFWQIARW